MNIGIVTTWFERGAAYVSKAFADILKTKHNVFIFARGGEECARNDNNWNGPNVTWGKRYSNPNLNFQINWPQFKKWVVDNNLELIIFNEQSDWEIIVNCRTIDVKIVSYIDYYKQNTVELFNLYDAVICNTNRHYQVFEKHKKCIYIPWGTDTELFKPKNIEKGKLTFFHSAGMGGVNLRKGTDVLVKAFNKLKVPAKLIIHSQAPIEKYAGISDIINNNPHIEFLHKTVTAPGLYHLGDVYVYPSKLEGIGLSIAEALSCGLPVITTRCAPMNEFVVNDYNGKLVDVSRYVSRSDGYYWPESECDEDSLLSCMIDMYNAYNKDKLERMKFNAREYATNKLNWTSNASEFCNIIENINIDENKFHNFKKYKDNALDISNYQLLPVLFWIDYYIKKTYRKIYMLD